MAFLLPHECLAPLRWAFATLATWSNGQILMQLWGEMGEGGGALRDIGCSTDSGEPLKHREAALVVFLNWFLELHCTAPPTWSPTSRVALLSYSTLDAWCEMQTQVHGILQLRLLPHTGPNSATTQKTPQQHPSPHSTPSSNAQVGHLFLKRNPQFANLVWPALGNLEQIGLRRQPAHNMCLCQPVSIKISYKKSQWSSHIKCLNKVLIYKKSQCSHTKCS